MRVSRMYTFFIIYLVLNFISGSAVLALSYSGLNPMFVSILWQLVFFIPVVFIGVKLTGDGIQTLCFNRVAVSDIILAVVLVIVLMPLMNLLSAVMALFFPNTATDSLLAAAQYPLWMSVVSFCVIPAVFEELIFRSIIFSGLKNVPLPKACAVGGILFAIAHFSAQAVLYTFFIGALFCYILYRTKSVIPSMVTHFTINFSQVALSRLVAQMPAEVSETVVQTDISGMVMQYVYLAILSLPILFYLISLMGRKYGRGKPLFYRPRPVFAIEDETVFDYRPQPQFAEKIFGIKAAVILIVYFVYIFYQYFALWY